MSTAEAALAPERRQTLTAVVDRILPGTGGPGAEATEAAAAVERAMVHACMRGLRGGIEQMLDRLESTAVERHARSFASCAPPERDELLRGLERDPNPWTQFLFRTVVSFSLEGLLGDPVHGGNRDFRGWDAMGLCSDDVRSGMCRSARGC